MLSFPTSENKINKLELAASVILIVGGLITIAAVFLFSWNEPKFDNELVINSAKFGDIGSFLSGTVGILWSLASVIYFILALREQRKDIQNNQKALELQIQELKDTKDVSIEQSNTFKIQRFENTFFQLVQLFNENTSNLTLKKSGTTYNGREVLTLFKQKLDTLDNARIKTVTRNSEVEKVSYRTIETIEDINEYIQTDFFREYYQEFQSSLNHYFRQLYHIYKYIHLSKLINENDRHFYGSLVRAQLSQNELYCIAFNSIIPNYGYPKLTFLIREYRILKNFVSHSIPSQLGWNYIIAKQTSVIDPFINNS